MRLERIAVAILLITVAVFAPAAGEPEPSQEAPNKALPVDSIASEFIIGAFPGPPDGQINLARFREIANAGIDVIVPFWGTMDGVHNPDMLDLAQAAGLRVLAMDKRIGP
ncbi:MAG: hypothetical protein ACYS74_12440, partial [Planctomycetota bacterium]